MTFPDLTFEHNEDGIWCPSCGELLVTATQGEEGYEEPEECSTCGFPDDIEKMRLFHEGLTICDNCGDEVPVDHTYTDTGYCITCQDQLDAEEEED